MTRDHSIAQSYKKSVIIDYLFSKLIMKYAEGTNNFRDMLFE